MRTDRFGRFGVIGFTAVLAFTFICGRPAAAGPTGELVGTIVDLDGRPVAKAKVSLKSRPPKTIASAETSADGRFRIGPIAPIFREQLLVDAPGFGPEHRENISVFPAAVNEIRIVVAPGRSVQGRILRIDGQPAAHLPVQYRITRSVTGRYLIDFVSPENHVTTDSRGEFRVDNVPPSRLSVHLSLPDSASGGTVAYVQPGSGVQTLPTLQLAPDVPIAGVVHNSQGKPLAKIPVTTNFADSPHAITDASGRFVLRGFRGKLIPQVCVVISMPDFVFERVDVGDHPSAVDVTLKPQRWISGRVVDAETGAPIAIKTFILCSFTRRANGEIDRGNCRPIPFDQPKTGQFRVAYRAPDNIHITVKAQGYDDAEANLDSRHRYEDIEGIVIKARRNGTPLHSDSIPFARITGTLTRDGRPATSAWVSAVRQKAERKFPYVDIQRGRTIRRESQVFPSVVASSTGTFLLELRNPGAWYILIEEPNRAPTIQGPFEMKMNETRKLDVRLADGGTISGRVRGIPAESAGAWWVVAFDRTVWTAEVRVSKDGTFRLDQLPAGEFGLKVGHDAYHDPDNPDQPTEADQQRVVNPWHGATLVRIRPGQRVTDVVLDVPPISPAAQTARN